MYDFIIVGAGSAGCVLANRLTANGKHNVLLLEAGEPDTLREIHIPAAFGELFRTAVDWNYDTVPQTCMDGRRLYQPRGKVLGGSSSINAMIYIRGSRRDYDNWAAQGNNGWSYDDILPYFKRAEDFVDGPDTYHGVGGPLRVENQRDPRPPSLAFIEAAQQVGIPPNPDFNGPTQEGAGLYHVTMRRGARHSTAGAYLKPALERPNLTVQTGTRVERLLHNGQRFNAVQVRQVDLTQAITARHEIILAGGSFNTPQILMLSGIGPGDHLRKHGLDTLIDLPGVGQNLQDHLAVGVAVRNRQPLSLITAKNPGNIAKYLLNRVGPLTSNVAEAGAYVRTQPNLPTPDIQFHFAPNYFINHGFANPGGHGMTLGAVLVTPHSRGQVTLASADPRTAPLIDPQYLSDADGTDLAALIAGTRLARKILTAPALAPFYDAEVLPGPEATTETDIHAHIRATGETLYHPVGTCKMGPHTDPTAVVDPALRLRGTTGVRVVDASVMPTIVNGNTNAPTVMIAEKAADMILADF